MLQNLFVIFLFSAINLFANDSENTLSISGTVHNLHIGYPLYIALYSSQYNFDNKIFTSKEFITADRITDTVIDFAISDFIEGDYIIAAYQDINGNKKIDMGMFGPKEPFVVYEPRYKFIPTFKKCFIHINSSISNISLFMR